MELIGLALPPAIPGTAPERWTRLHPLAVGGAIGLLPGLLGTLTMTDFCAGGPTILAAAGVCFSVGCGIGALGACGGWLRWMNVERIR